MAQIKYKLGAVGGIIVTELWSGSVGNIKGEFDKTEITLNDDITNYKFLILDFYCSLGGSNSKRYYSRVISVQQFTNLFNSADTYDTHINFNMGYNNFNDYFDIYQDSTTKALNISSRYTLCLRIVGIN